MAIVCRRISSQRCPVMPSIHLAVDIVFLLVSTVGVPGVEAGKAVVVCRAWMQVLAWVDYDSDIKRIWLYEHGWRPCSSSSEPLVWVDAGEDPNMSSALRRRAVSAEVAVDPELPLLLLVTPLLLFPLHPVESTADELLPLVPCAGRCGIMRSNRGLLASDATCDVAQDER